MLKNKNGLALFVKGIGEKVEVYDGRSFVCFS